MTFEISKNLEMMKTIKLYRFKDSIAQKMPLIRENDILDSLNDLMAIDMINTEKVTEYTIEVSDDFNFENHDNDQLIELCNSSENAVDHHFITNLEDSDMI
jgi:hypothetical protein